MRVTLKNLTDMTIAFNKLGIILRGHCNNPEYVMSNIARNVEITTKDQEIEIKSLERAKIIEIIYLDAPAPKVEEVKVELLEKPTKHKRIRKVSEIKTEEDNKATVVTTNGPVNTQTFNTIKASETPLDVKESILAMQKIEEEDRKKNVPINEKKFKTEEKIGSDAIISMGNNTFKKVAMKRSVIDAQNEVTEKNDPFIDKKTQEIAEKEEQRVKNAFIDTDDKTNNDKNDDAFVEI